MVGGYNWMNLVKKIFWKFYSKFVCSIKFGQKSYIIRPLQIDSAKSILIGKDVIVYDQCWFYGGQSDKSNTLIIEDGVRIGHFAHIIAMNNVHIKKHVLIADKVFISDCTHNYDDVGLPILSQGTKVLSEVTIGEDSWIGENVCICGASIGKHCVIGANSVVTKDIPDYCVAAGIPAKVIKKYNFEKNSWDRI